MKFRNLLVLAALAAGVYAIVFFGERQIDKKIDEAIQSNINSEILAIKEKLDKQSELISSIVGLTSKNDGADGGSISDSDDKANNSADKSDNAKNAFDYVVENGGITITKYTGNQISVQIPDKIDGIPVLKIGKNAFAESKIKSVTIPAYCSEIDWFAFYGCFALSTVYIPSSVEVIGYGAFDSCSKSITVYAESDSYAARYALSFGISFSEI